MTGTEFKYWAFLSYSPLDNCEQRPGATEADQLRWADRLVDTLKSFTVPAEFVGQPNSRGDIIPARIDAVYQPASPVSDAELLSATDRQALERSRCLIVICSPRAAQSAAVNEAVRVFKQLGRGNRILPLVIAGEPNASEGSKPGVAPASECFVPALLHPVSSDGEVDEAHREAGYFFADARFGVDRSEITTRTELSGEAEQAIARIHLISGVLGVGFYGLWQREQKRRFVGFAEAQQQVREVQSQFEFARDQAQTAQAQLQALQAQARETLGQLEAARQEARVAQDKLLANQNVPLDIQSQIREAQDRALDAQNRSQAMQNQLEALQTQSRVSQEQLESARQQVQAAEQKAVEAQQQARIAQAQVDQARQHARDSEQQLNAAREELRSTQEKAAVRLPVAVDSRSSDAELENQLRDAQEQLRSAQAGVEAALSRAQAAEAGLAAAQSQAREAQQQVLELQNQARTAQSQLDAARLEIQTTQGQVVAAQQLVKAAQAEILAVRNETSEAQARFEAVQKQADEATNQSRAAQENLSAAQAKVRASQRLTKVLAVLAVLAAMAAGAVLTQRKVDKNEPADRGANEPGSSASATNRFDGDQIRQALMQRRELDTFAERIPAGQISETLNLAAGILTEQQYAGLQDQLLAAWTRTNALAAFDWSRQLTNTTFRPAALAQTIPAMANDGSNNAVVAFDWLQEPTNATAFPSGALRDWVVTGFFSNWAAKDVEAAAANSEKLSALATKTKVSSIILSQRITNDPAVAAGFITNLAAGDLRQNAIAALGDRWGMSDATNALAWSETLPAASERRLTFQHVLKGWAAADLPAVTNWLASVPFETKTQALQTLATIWAHQDAKGLADYAFTWPMGDTQSYLLSQACRVIATNDFAAVVELLQPLTNNIVLRENLLEQAAGNSPRLEATSEYVATMAAGEDQRAAIKGLITKWSEVAPEAALAWLRALPEINAQPAQVEFALKSWAQQEPAATAQWLANQSAGAITETMFTAFLDGAVAKYPEFAAQWTLGVTDEAQRQKLQVQLAKAWLQHDAIAAQKWIETLDLPGRIKRTLK